MTTRKKRSGKEKAKEIFNRKIANMVELLKAGHKYKNQEWRVGDAAERKYM
ncbi:unnamed protein product [Brassica oleracea]|uniref:(rape) hypothetical protein n=1 Tax=Brassica napus TaxID=3708 RepID=A0A816IB89_BRANA|nr:unnamed protein product [Brassica napus]